MEGDIDMVNQRLGRRVQDSSPHPRLAKNNRRRGVREERNTTLRSPSAQEMKDGPEKNKEDKRRDN
jgi:hypothetical protein